MTTTEGKIYVEGTNGEDCTIGLDFEVFQLLKRWHKEGGCRNGHNSRCIALCEALGFSSSWEETLKLAKPW